MIAISSQLCLVVIKIICLSACVGNPSLWHCKIEQNIKSVVSNYFYTSGWGGFLEGCLSQYKEIFHKKAADPLSGILQAWFLVH